MHTPIYMRPYTHIHMRPYTHTHTYTGQTASSSMTSTMQSTAGNRTRTLTRNTTMPASSRHYAPEQCDQHPRAKTTLLLHLQTHALCTSKAHACNRTADTVSAAAAGSPPPLAWSAAAAVLLTLAAVAAAARPGRCCCCCCGPSCCRCCRQCISCSMPGQTCQAHVQFTPWIYCIYPALALPLLHELTP